MSSVPAREVGRPRGLAAGERGTKPTKAHLRLLAGPPTLYPSLRAAIRTALGNARSFDRVAARPIAEQGRATGARV